MRRNGREKRRSRSMRPYLNYAGFPIAATKRKVPPYWRPKTREDCSTFGRPCPYVGCPYHLYGDVNPRNGTLKRNFPGLEVWEMEETCVLDIVDRGELPTLREIGGLMNITREAVRQIQEKAIHKLGVVHRCWRLLEAVYYQAPTPVSGGAIAAEARKNLRLLKEGEGWEVPL